LFAIWASSNSVWNFGPERSSHDHASAGSDAATAGQFAHLTLVWAVGKVKPISRKPPHIKFRTQMGQAVARKSLTDSP